MRHNLLTKILVLVLALLVLIPNMGLGVFAADDGPTNEGGSDTPTESFDVSGSKTADPKLLIGDERETTVTLSLPSAEYQNDVYILFTADTSSSISNNSIDLGEMVGEMFSDILEMNPNLEINVGVLKFTGKISDAIKIVSGGKYEGFVRYSDDLSEIIDLAIDAPSTKDYKNTPSNYPQYTEETTIPGRGSNLAGVLDISEEWLDALVEDGVEKNKIYLVVLTDGKSYIWNNEKNEPVTYYTQYYNHYAMLASKTGNARPTIGQQTGSRDKEAYPVQVEGTELFLYGYTNKDGSSYPEKSDSSLYQALYDLSENNPYFEEINNTDGKFDEFCLYVDSSLATLTGGLQTYQTTNGSALTFQNPHTGNTSSFQGDYKSYTVYTPDEEYKNYDYFTANPYDVVRNEDGSIKVDENGKVTFDTESINEDFYMLHPDSLQKSLYLSGHLWTDLNEKYNCGVVVFRNKMSKDDTGWAADGGLGPAASFDTWILENSQYAADILNKGQVTAMFSDINNDMLYMVSKGVVTDQITDDFTLKNSANGDGFRMTLDGETLQVVYTEGKWNFGTAVDEVYPYVVEYNASTNTITWTINVPIENAKPVTLSYDLLLTDESAETSAIYDTNKSAILEYKSTDGKKDGTFTFEVPKVAYIKLIDINVEKQWVDYDNKDGSRPQEVTVQLIELIDDEEELVDEGVLNEKTWKYTFEDVLDATAVFENDEPVEIVPIVYTIKEPAVKGYTPALSGSVEKGFVITNTHEPEFSFFIAKIWDDEQDADGVRPESVTVNLLANGEPIDTAELGDFNMWTASYTVPFYDADGEPIEYTVTEEPVEGYEKPEIVFDPDYSVYLVTNTHKVTEPPKTDDATNQWFWAGMMVSSMALIAVIFYLKRRQDEE